MYGICDVSQDEPGLLRNESGAVMSFESEDAADAFANENCPDMMDYLVLPIDGAKPGMSIIAVDMDGEPGMIADESGNPMFFSSDNAAVDFMDRAGFADYITDDVLSIEPMSDDE